MFRLFIAVHSENESCCFVLFWFQCCFSGMKQIENGESFVVSGVF